MVVRGCASRTRACVTRSSQLTYDMSQSCMGTVIHARVSGTRVGVSLSSQLTYDMCGSHAWESSTRVRVPDAHTCTTVLTTLDLDTWRARPGRTHRVSKLIAEGFKTSIHGARVPDAHTVYQGRGLDDFDTRHVRPATHMLCIKVECGGFEDLDTRCARPGRAHHVSRLCMHAKPRNEHMFCSFRGLFADLA